MIPAKHPNSWFDRSPVRTVRTDRKMEPTWTKNGAKIESTGDKLRANSAKSNFWNTRFYKTKLADLLPKSTPQPRGITIKFKCDFDCTFLTSLARTRRRVLLLASGLSPLASGLWPGLGGTRVALKSAAALRAAWACRKVEFLVTVSKTFRQRH